MEPYKGHCTHHSIEGKLFILLGILAFIFPSLVLRFGTALALGSIFVVAAIIKGYGAYKCSDSVSVGMSSIIAIVYLVVGALLLFYPIISMLSLTILLTIYFAIIGLARIILALENREKHHWRWLLVSGIIGLVFAVIIWAGRPFPVYWFAGFLVGIDMVVYGIAKSGMSCCDTHYDDDLKR